MKYIIPFNLQRKFLSPHLAHPARSLTFPDILLCFVTLSVQIAASKKSNPAIVLLFPPNCFPYPLFLDQVAKVKMSLWPNYLLCLTWLRLLTHRGHTSCTENRSLITKCTTCNYFFIPFCASSFNCTFSSPAWLSSQIFGIQRTAWQKRKTEKKEKPGTQSKK